MVRQATYEVGDSNSDFPRLDESEGSSVAGMFVGALAVLLIGMGIIGFYRNEICKDECGAFGRRSISRFGECYCVDPDTGSVESVDNLLKSGRGR